MKLFIAYEWELACPENIAVKLKDGRYRYIHKDKKSRINQEWEMSPLNPIPIKDFGIELSYEDKNLIGKPSGEPSNVNYADGTQRKWLGSRSFTIPCKQNPKNFGIKKHEQA